MKIINIEFNYEFLGNGISVDEIEENTLYLDVGNKLEKGIIDHHHLENAVNFNERKFLSTTSLILISMDLIPNSKEQTYKIVTHRSPDFDSIAAIYLAKEYLLNGCFPKYSHELAQYVEQVDCGKMKIDASMIRAPVVISYFLKEVVKKKLDEEGYDGKKDNFYKYNLEIIAKGLKLIDYIMRRMDKLPEKERSLYHPNLFLNGNEFEYELSLAKEDYKNYEKDIQTIVRKDKIKLPTLSMENLELEEVDALFWQDTPKCRLHKYWARQDSNAPLGKGYNLLFIPIYINKKIKLEAYERENLINSKDNKEEIIDFLNEKMWNRVIISVDPSSNVNLKGLAIELEKEENKLEKEILKSNLNFYRDQSRRRFNDYWINNDDPWFDGRNGNYTIVDGPRRGSLISIKNIEKIVENFTEPKVVESKMRFIFPFNFEIKRKNDKEAFFSLCEMLDSNKNFVSSQFYDDIEKVEKFFPYIQTYLFNSNTENSKKIINKNFHSFHCKLHKDMELIIDEEILKFKTSMLLFRYGIGYIILEKNLNYSKENLLNEARFNDILEFNNKVCYQNNEIESKVFEELNIIKGKIAIHLKKGIVYTLLKVEESKFYKNRRKDMVYSICNQINLKKSYMESEFVNNISNDIFLECEKNIIYGFGKGGGCLLVGFNEDVRSIKLIKKHYWQKFMDFDFYIFILSLHQRNSLMNFMEKLSYLANQSNNVSKIRKLRFDLMDFMTQGWFSQITQNELGMKLYSYWERIFCNNTLYNEISERLSSVDDYKKTERNRRIDTISVIFLPLVLMSSIFSMNILKGEGTLTISIKMIPIIIVILLVFVKIYLSLDEK